MEFNIGDRVKIYLPFRCRIGTVHSIAEDTTSYGSKPLVGSLQVQLLDGKFEWFHPKQCRKLVKKKAAFPEYVWLPKEWQSNDIEDLTNGGWEYLGAEPPTPELLRQHVEYRRVGR